MDPGDLNCGQPWRLRKTRQSSSTHWFEPINCRPSSCWRDRYTSLSIVLDHAGVRPSGNPRRLASWRAQMQRLAERANVSCKLSGLITELPAA